MVVAMDLNNLSNAKWIVKFRNKYPYFILIFKYWTQAVLYSIIQKFSFQRVYLYYKYNSCSIFLLFPYK